MIDSQTSPSPSAASAADARVWQIRTEQILACLRTVRVSVAVHVLTGVITIVGLSDVVSRTHLLIWGGALSCVLALGVVATIVYGRLYGRRALDPSRRYWLIIGVGGIGAVGVVWGAAGIFLFPPQSLEHQLLLLFAIGGLGAGAVPTLGPYLPWFYAYFPVSVLPIGVRLLQSDEPIQPIFGLMALIYVAGIIGSARLTNKAFTMSLGLQFENADLARELAVQRDEAERANIGKSKFLAAASHDLRQPLHALGLFTTVLDEQVTQPKVRQLVGKISESVHALQKMFDVLLDMSRLDAGVMRPSVCHFYLRDLFMRLVSDYMPEAEAKGLGFACDAGEVVVRSDPALLDQILRNLVANAVRYTNTGEIRVDVVARDGDVRIRVADTGIGIAPEQQRAIFEEFHQLGNPERDRNKGLGLGLAIVDRVARLLGHHVSVESTLGKGSCFSVDVPRGEVRLVAADQAATTKVAGDLTGLHVVVIDDDIAARAAISTLLEHWRCEIIPAGSEEEAVAAIRSAGGAPNAIIADYRLREGGDGTQAIARLRREFGADIPALIVTGDTGAERLRDVKASGHQVLHKPIPPASLRAFLANARARMRNG